MSNPTSKPGRHHRKIARHLASRKTSPIDAPSEPSLEKLLIVAARPCTAGTALRWVCPSPRRFASEECSRTGSKGLAQRHKGAKKRTKRRGEMKNASLAHACSHDDEGPFYM